MAPCGFLCWQEAPVAVERPLADGRPGQKGAHAMSAYVYSCQDGGACTLLQKGKCCARLFIIILVQERGNVSE